MTNASNPSDGHFDITPPICSVYASSDETSTCPSVVMLNAEASPAQLLGYAYSRVHELLTLACFASLSDETEHELRHAARLIWEGLETVQATLDAMAKRMGRS